MKSKTRLLGIAFIGFTLTIILLGTLPILQQTLKVENRDRNLAQRGDILYYKNNPFSGILIERYLNGALYRESHYLRGKKEGSEKEYTLNGVLVGLFHFHLHKKEGLQLGWFANGLKKFEYHYKEGLFEGEQTEWHQTGVVFRRQVFTHGVETDKKILYQGGEIFSNYSKREGRTYGLDGGAICFDFKKDGEK